MQTLKNYRERTRQHWWKVTLILALSYHGSVSGPSLQLRAIETLHLERMLVKLEKLSAERANSPDPKPKVPGDELWGAPDADWEPSADPEVASNTSGETQ
jgi:hypothetical protein